MKRKTKKLIKKTLITIGIILAILLFLGLIYYGGTHGWFQGVFNFGQDNWGDINPDDFDDNSEYWVKLSIVPLRICVGDEITGTVTSNILDGTCRTFFNPNSEGWRTLEDFNLVNGYYSREGTISVTGYAYIVTICCDANMSCAMSNQERLISEVCDDSDSDSDSSSYTCGIASSCYSGTCPTSYTCEELIGAYAVWCACIDNSGNVHPDWKPEGDNYNPRECQDSDGGYSIYVKGTCTDKYGYSFIDYCETNEIGNKYLVEYTCQDGYCIPQDVSCPYMNSACTDGACWEL